MTDDLRDLGERCGKHRVARLMRSEGLRAQVGYSRRRTHYGGSVATVAPNLLDRQFDVSAPNTHWVTDITYLRTHEGWLYLAVVLDLYSRQVVGWAMDSRMQAALVLEALLAAVWRRKPAAGLMIYSDQGSQFTGGEWQAFLKTHALVCSMSRRGNGHDNAVAESFFQLLKRERIRPKIYRSRAETRRVRLHRDVLQPQTPAWIKPGTVSGRVRAACGNDGLVGVYESRGDSGLSSGGVPLLACIVRNTPSDFDERGASATLLERFRTGANAGSVPRRGAGVADRD